MKVSAAAGWGDPERTPEPIRSVIRAYEAQGYAVRVWNMDVQAGGYTFGNSPQAFRPFEVTIRLSVWPAEERPARRVPPTEAGP